MTTAEEVYDEIIEQINESEQHRKYLEEKYNETGDEKFAAQATRERGALEGLRQARDIVQKLEFEESMESEE